MSIGTEPIDKGSAPGKWGVIATSILGAVLLIASIWSLSRALNNSSPHGSVAITNEAATINAVLSQEELEKEYVAEQRTVPVIPSPAVTQSVVAPTKQHEDEVKLQKAKSKVNQRIVERMKQYVKDNPSRDNRDLEEQIKKRENQGAPIQ